MRQYLVCFYPRGEKNVRFELSTSRNAIRHMIEKDAETVWIYNKAGWWIGFADRDENDKPYRPVMYPDGEPKQFFKEKFAELAAS